jgi:Asp-tRNA(Asn)/Glu-tRNA(Gln) amidotransferase A subunit family amidase
VSEDGAAELCWSLAHIGPIGATVSDVALGYAIMAGRDTRDPNTHVQPPVTLEGVSTRDLRGIRLGIYRPWFEDADPFVVHACERMLEGLVARGAEIAEIELQELALVRTVHLLTIISEMATAHLHHYAKHRAEYGHDVRLILAVGRRLSASDYLHAQRHRARLVRQFFDALERVDAIVTPTTGCTAPALPDDSLDVGEVDLTGSDRIMRFALPGNLTGLPAITWVAGYGSDGLPIGIHAMGRPWHEHVLLRIAHVGEGLVQRRAPRVHYKLLDR